MSQYDDGTFVGDEYLDEPADIETIEAARAYLGLPLLGDGCEAQRTARIHPVDPEQHVELFELQQEGELYERIRDAVLAPPSGFFTHEYVPSVGERPMLVVEEGRKRAMLNTLEERDHKGNLMWLRSSGDRT